MFFFYSLRFLVADSTPRQVGRSVGPCVTLFNCELFLHYCPCPIICDAVAAYLAFFRFVCSQDTLVLKKRELTFPLSPPSQLSIVLSSQSTRFLAYSCQLFEVPSLTRISVPCIGKLILCLDFYYHVIVIPHIQADNICLVSVVMLSCHVVMLFYPLVLANTCQRSQN